MGIRIVCHNGRIYELDSADQNKNIDKFDEIELELMKQMIYGHDF
jgi:hypothetical protein